jgi:hypothetical protein
MNKLAVIQQGWHKENNYIKQQREAFKGVARVYRLNWGGDATDIHANCIVTKPIKWSAGRQLMWELIEEHIGPHEYYLFTDDDVIFNSRGEEYIKFLDEWNPIFATGQRLKRKPSVQIYGLGKDGKLFRCYGADVDNDIFRRDFLLQMYPLPRHGNGWVTWLANWILEHTVPEKMICNPNLVIENTGHRPRGKAHGIMDSGLHEIISYWNTFLKISYPLGKIRCKVYENEYRNIHSTAALRVVKNRENEKQKEKLITKKYMPFTHNLLSLMVETEHPNWINRKPLLSEYEDDIILRGME